MDCLLLLGILLLSSILLIPLTSPRCARSRRASFRSIWRGSWTISSTHNWVPAANNLKASPLSLCGSSSGSFSRRGKNCLACFLSSEKIVFLSCLGKGRIMDWQLSVCTRKPTVPTQTENCTFCLLFSPHSDALNPLWFRPSWLIFPLTSATCTT